MKWTLRDYQKRACRRTVDAFEKGHPDVVGRITAALLIAATGAGKTIIACAILWYIASKKTGRCLFLADTDELVDQAVEKIIKATGIIPDIEKAERHASLKASIVVSSIQSMKDRTHLFPPDHFDMVVADEAHLSMSAMWQLVLWYFRKWDGCEKHGPNPNGAMVLGITATPERQDKKLLLDFYQVVTDEIPLLLLIERKHLSPIIVQTIPLRIAVTSTAGEADNERQAEEIRPYYEEIIQHVIDHTRDRRATLLFHPSRRQSQTFADMMVDRGLVAAHVDGTSRNRRELLEDFAAGNIAYMNNKQLLVKGYDNPKIDCIVPVLAVGSRTNYIQMAGRGTRLFCPHGCDEWCAHADRKMDMLLLDFFWQFKDKNVMRPANLVCDSKEAVAALSEALAKGDRQMNLAMVNEEAQREREQALIAALKRGATKGPKRLDARAWAATFHEPALLDYEPAAKWEEKKPTGAQLGRLTKWGIDVSTITSRGMASLLLESMYNRFSNQLATLGQVNKLNARGIAHPERLTKEAAAAILAS